MAERRPLLTTNFILAKTHALLLTRVGREAAARVLFEIDRSPLTTTVRVTEVDEARAREVIVNFTDKPFSLTDALSFVVMERLGIHGALTHDRNFAQYGFATDLA